MYYIDKEKVFWRCVDGEMIILNIDSGHYYSLDGVGGAIWGMVVNSRNEEEIAAGITGEYSVDKKTAREDIRGFIKVLKNEELVQVR